VQIYGEILATMPSSASSSGVAEENQAVVSSHLLGRAFSLRDLLLAGHLLL
jgi:hypothetical protein